MYWKRHPHGPVVSETEPTVWAGGADVPVWMQGAGTM